MPLHPIRTERLNISPPFMLELEGHYYLEDFHAIYSDPDVQQYLGMSGGPVTHEHVADILDEENEARTDDNSSLLALHNHALNRVVGIVKVQSSPMEAPRDVEIVYAIHSDFRRVGYAKEGLRAVLDHEFRCGRRHIVARVAHDNEASVALLVALGFVRGIDRDVRWGMLEESERVYELTSSAQAAM